MSKWRKKPVVIEAVEWFRDVHIDGVDVVPDPDHPGQVLGRIKTLEDHKESYHYGSEGDWLITGVEGEIYFCKPDIFHKTYEAVPVYKSDCIDWVLDHD